MGNSLQKNDIELHEAFGIILSIETFSDYISDISELVYKNNLNSENLNVILKENGIKDIKDIKEELLDLLIIYINLVLNDHIISDHEKENIELLKKYFKIKEGDFYKNRFFEIDDILNRQFERLYSDNQIDRVEEIHHFNLQDIFDLGYDQYDKFKETEVRNALERGADIIDLDTARFPKPTSKSKQIRGRIISQEVKNLVWNRDGGKCRECESNENLEFDHIIPFSKGGSNTYRNIQLLCEPCNRKKSAKIG